MDRFDSWHGDFSIVGSNLSKVIFVGSILGMAIEKVSCSNLSKVIFVGSILSIEKVSCSILSMVIFCVVGSILSMVIRDFLVSCSNPVLEENFGTGSILGMAIEKVSCSNLSKVIL